MQAKQVTRRNWKRLLGLIVAGMAVFFLDSCTSKSDLERTKPPCDWELWEGNPAKEGITRLASIAPILCSDPKFSDYVCLSSSDFKNLLTCGGK